MALSVGNSIYLLHDTLNDYQPLSYFEYHSDGNEYVVLPTNIPDNYKHWLQIFNDAYGDYIDVLYPTNITAKEDIIILYRGFYEKENQWKKIRWKHGNKNLFYLKILPLLEIERTYDADISEFEHLLKG